MKSEEVNRCQIQEWYPRFKSISLTTIIHKLPQPFVDYLTEDSGPFLLPLSISNEDAFPSRIHKPEDEEDYQISDGSDDEDETTDQPSPPSFPELELEIKESIQTLGGSVFPKLNWSSPKDAAWISSTGCLKCTSLSEIALLLRSSDSVAHDLGHAYDSCEDKTSSIPTEFYLALRKWYPSLRPEMEFRCFVHGNRLIAICQREVTNCYPIIVERKDELEGLIFDFYEDNLKERFESENYTFDVYITRRCTVKLVDFSPWGAFTLPLMFEWDELDRMSRGGGEEGIFEFRIVETRRAVRPGLKTAVPYDYLDTSPGSGWDQFLKKADEELKQQSKLSNEDRD